MRCAQGKARFDLPAHLETTQPLSQHHVLLHDGDPFRMESTRVGVLKQLNQKGFTCLLKSEHCRARKAQVFLLTLCNLSDEPLKRQLFDEQLGALLVPTNFAKRHSSWAITVRPFNAADRRTPWWFLVLLHNVD